MNRTNDILDQWDRESFFHPSTHLGQHARGESPNRIMTGGSGVFVEDRDGTQLLDGFAGLYCVNVGYGRQEMETARRLDSNITVMVWEDGGYGLISWEQDQEFGEHPDLAFGNPDWCDLAKSFGWDFAKVENARDLSGAIDDALEHDGPSLIVVPIDYVENMLLTERLGAVEGTL